MSKKSQRAVLKKLFDGYSENLMSDKKLRILNRSLVPKNVKGDHLDFSTSVLWQKIKKNERGPLGDNKKFSKIKTKYENFEGRF